MTGSGSLGLSFWTIAKNKLRLSIEPVIKRLCHDCRSVTRMSPSSPRQTGNSLPWRFVPTSRQKPHPNFTALFSGREDRHHRGSRSSLPPMTLRALDQTIPSIATIPLLAADILGKPTSTQRVSKTAARAQGAQRPPELVATTGVFQVNAMPCVILLGRPSTWLARMRRIGSQLGHAIAR
jgi:hypothetical protein